MIDRDDLLDLCGSDVLEVGVRQALPFITFGVTAPERTENTLLFSVSDSTGISIEGPIAARLEPLVARTVTEVRLAERGITIQFDYSAELVASNVATPGEPPLWLGKET